MIYPPHYLHIHVRLFRFILCGALVDCCISGMKISKNWLNYLVPNFDYSRPVTWCILSRGAYSNHRRITLYCSTSPYYLIVYSLSDNGDIPHHWREIKSCTHHLICRRQTPTHMRISDTEDDLVSSNSLYRRVALLTVDSSSIGGR